MLGDKNMSLLKVISITLLLNSQPQAGFFDKLSPQQKQEKIEKIIKERTIVLLEVKGGVKSKLVFIDSFDPKYNNGRIAYKSVYKGTEPTNGRGFDNLSNIYLVQMYPQPKIQVEGDFNSNKVKVFNQIWGGTSNRKIIIVNSWFEQYEQILPDSYSIKPFDPKVTIYEENRIEFPHLGVSNEYDFIVLSNSYLLVSKKNKYFNYPLLSKTERSTSKHNLLILSPEQKTEVSRLSSGVEFEAYLKKAYRRLKRNGLLGCSDAFTK